MISELAAAKAVICCITGSGFLSPSWFSAQHESLSDHQSASESGVVMRNPYSST